MLRVKALSWSFKNLKLKIQFRDGRFRQARERALWLKSRAISARFVPILENNALY